MAKKSGEESSVVKIDFSLLKKIDDFIKKEENKFRFVNKKQFVDIAVYEFLERLEKGGNNER